MRKYDRLTTLMQQFHLTVTRAPVDQAALVVTAGGDGAPDRVIFAPAGRAPLRPGAPVVFAARVDWGGDVNPLIASLPPVVTLDVTADPDTANLVALMQSELTADRCGAGSVLDRLAEVLMVRLLRHLIEDCGTEPGLLAGLADPRISRAIVAMHDAPGRDWRNEDLAQIAGLSLSRFSELFHDRVALRPAAYLRQWRLTLARNDLRRGDRVDRVARRYGYGSPEGFAKAFRRQFGTPPIAERRNSAA